MAKLINIAKAEGNYQSMQVTDTTELIVELSAVSIAKRADKQIWLDGDLNYAIVVENVDARDPGDPVDPGAEVDQLVVTDTIDPKIARFIDGSLIVTVGDDPTPVVDPHYTYDDLTGLLTVDLDPLEAGQHATISFRVARVEP